MQYVKTVDKETHAKLCGKKRHSPLLPMGKRIASKKKTGQSNESFQGRLEIPVFGRYGLKGDTVMMCCQERNA